MKKILAFGGSNSFDSINKTLAVYAASQIENAELHVADLNDYDLPIYSGALEAESGIPENALKFAKLIEEADGIVLSLAEHNGLTSAVFKNLFDWLTRIDQNVWKDKPMLLMAASPGPRGGMNVLGVMKNLLPYFGGNVVGEFSLPSFFDNFVDGELKTDDLKKSLIEQVNLFSGY